MRLHRAMVVRAQQERLGAKRKPAAWPVPRYAIGDKAGQVPETMVPRILPASAVVVTA